MDKSLLEKGAPNINEILNSIESSLFGVAQDLISENTDLTKERNKAFLKNPDDPQEHEPNWHQWGVVTHTKMLRKYYEEEVPSLIQAWGVESQVNQELAQEIEGRTRRDLLQIALLLHDLGKFAGREVRNEGGQESLSFKQHEAVSGVVIRSEKFSNVLRSQYSLNDKQIEYIARCAELHYELGKMRDRAKKLPSGYSLSFAQGEDFKEIAEEMRSEFPEYRLEVGFMFLIDSLAKTEMRIKSESDNQIGAQEAEIEDFIKKRELGEKLKNAIKQLPVNVEVSKRYLQLWASTV